MSKYNAKPKTVNGITFDSTAEAAYYALLLSKVHQGEIQGFDTQPEFILQEAFKKNGKTYREIRYVADFLIVENDCTETIVDVKGFETPDFKIKKKMFEFKYPEYSLKLMTFKYGRWMALEEYQKEKKARKSSYGSSSAKASQCGINGKA